MKTRRQAVLRLLRTCMLILAAVATLPSAASARFARGQEVPVERLLQNTAAYVKEHPDDPQGYYLLGRINALAFVLKTDKLRTFAQADQQLPTLDHWQSKPPESQQPPTAEQLRKHVVDSITNFRKAITMKPGEGLHHLGLAYILETGAEVAHKIGLPPGAAPGAQPASKPSAEEVAAWKALIEKLSDDDGKVREAAQRKLAAQMPAAAGTLTAYADDKDLERQTRVRALLAGCWRERALAEYLRAHNLAFKDDRKTEHQPIRGLMSLVSYEAGKSYVRLANERGVGKDEEKTVAQVEKDLQELDAKPRGPITPIIFSLAPTRGLSDLLAPGSAVRFDLDGDGQAQTWPWVRPTTGILVWDPAGRGRITSGRQLFGSVTFWMFFNDGFHAMNALDDDRDGKLSGSELHGLAVWFDRNGNGRSDPGEVVPVERLGIGAIETRPAGNVGREGTPFHPSGLKLTDGTTRAIYDWTPHPLPGR